VITNPNQVPSSAGNRQATNAAAGWLITSFPLPRIRALERPDQSDRDPSTRGTACRCRDFAPCCPKIPIFRRA